MHDWKCMKYDADILCLLLTVLISFLVVAFVICTWNYYVLCQDKCILQIHVTFLWHETLIDLKLNNPSFSASLRYVLHFVA